MSKKQSFIKGAMILIVANAISKVLGAVFKIPLTYILEEEGMAIFNTAFSVYITIMSFVISGMPLAISKLVAEEVAFNRTNSVRKIVRVSLVLLSILGILGTLIMYFGASVFALAMNDPKSIYAMQLIAPSIFFVAIGVAYKSYYQGTQNMTPTAVSQVIEAVIKLVVGFAFSIVLAKYVMEITACGAIMGVTIGEIIATAVLMMMYKPEKTGHDKKLMPTRKILKNLFLIAVPMLFAATVSSVVSFIDVALVRNQLQKVVFDAQTIVPFLTQYASHTSIFDTLQSTMRITADGARWLYGAYSGYALTIFHLPTGIMGAFCTSILPVIAGAMAVGNRKRAGYTMNIAIRLTILITLPCAVILYLFSDSILYTLFHNTASSLLLKTLAPCVVMVCISQLCTASLQASGKIMTPFWYALACAGIKLAGNFFLIPIARFNIQGAVISSNLCYLMEMIFGLYFVHKQFGMNISMGNMIIKPIIATVGMGAGMYMLYEPFCMMLGGDTLGFCASLGFGGILYLLLLILTNSISVREIRSLKQRL